MSITPRRTLFLVTLLTSLTCGCDKGRRAKEPVGATRHPPKSPATAPSAPPTESSEKATAAPRDSQDSKKSPPTVADCDTSIKFSNDEPVFLPRSKVMVTRIMSACLDPKGVEGFRKNAGWMAMGFPCTGGEGRIDWKGTNYQRPKMVSFLLETSCIMGPTDKTKIQEEAGAVLGISKEANFVAFNPFVIQYWEIPGYDEADMSFLVELRSNKGLDQGWTNFIKPKPMRIFLVGRENAWVPGNYRYAVEGDLHWVNKNRFTFKVEKARVLSPGELAEIKGRCEALKPPRDCSQVF